MKDSQHSELLAAIFLAGAGVAHGAAGFVLSALCVWEIGASIYYGSRERRAQGATHDQA